MKDKIEEILDKHIENAEGESEFSSIAGSAYWNTFARKLRKMKDEIMLLIEDE